MPDEPTGKPDEQTPAQKEEISQTLAKDEEKEETFTKSEITRMLKKQAAELTAKYKPLEEKAKKLDELEQAGKSELEKLQHKLEKATKDLEEKDKELTGTSLKLAKITALLKAGAQPDKIDGLAKRVSGTTPEEIEVDVQELVDLGWIGNTPAPDPKPAADGSGKPKIKDGLKKFTKSQLEKMTPEEYEANRADIMKAMEGGLIQ